MASTNASSSSKVIKLFATESSIPFNLLIILLAFNSFRPDRLIAGGSILLYFPALILLILLIYWIQTPQKTLYNSQTKHFFLFILVIVVEAFLARNHSRAFVQLKSTFFYTFIPYLVMIQFIDTSFKVERYIRLFLVLSSFLVFIGITNKGLVRIPMLADENEFALFTNLLIPIAYFLGQETNVKWSKIFYYTIVIFFILGTVTSFSRGGLVGLASSWSLFIF